jgi:TonB family protein
MAVISLAAHVAVGMVLAFSPQDWLSRPVEAPPPVMTITLGGAGTGPQSGGLTALGARPVQTPEPRAAREAVRRPAAATPESTLPAPNARVSRPRPTVEQAPREARGRTPARGDEPRAGTAVAETGARGQGFGLSTSGGAGFGSTLDVANFCCPDYIVLMTDRISQNWNQRTEVSGEVIVVFTIQRDGALTGIEVERSSGYAALDLSARRAVLVTARLPPLPAAFPNPTLTVHLNFAYQR